LQSLVKPKPFPELIADMNWDSLTMLPAVTRAGSTLSRVCAAARLTVRPERPLRRPPAQANNFGDFVVIPTEQIILTDECVLDFVGELEPLFARPQAEVAERIDRLLARSAWRHDVFRTSKITTALF
jgi:hypothetical protein